VIPIPLLRQAPHRCVQAAQTETYELNDYNAPQNLDKNKGGGKGLSL